MTKKCFKCHQYKDISQFYKHKEMADGHLNKCKHCTKKDVRRRYYDPESRKKIIAYEKKRFKDPNRKAKLKIYRKRMRDKSPGKYKARMKIGNSLRDNIIKKKPCEVCGDINSEAHHPDYRKPLDVKWLCRKHHMEEEGKISYMDKE